MENENRFFYKNSIDPKIRIEKGSTILEWDQDPADTDLIEKISIERKLENSDWLSIGIYSPVSNILTCRFIDDTDFPLNNRQKIFIVSYRLKTSYKDGCIETSSIFSYDFWWKKYLSFIENYEEAPYPVSQDIFRIIEESVKNIVYKKYLSAIHNSSIDEYFLIEEACQEIFLRLLEKKSHPGTNYYSFWKYLSTVAHNWVLSYLLKNNRRNITKLTDDLHELEKSPEDKLIKYEENRIFLRAFSRLFNVYLQELWSSLPLCALILESWIRRKKEFLENFSECLNRSLDQSHTDKLNLDKLEFNNGEELSLYAGILRDIMSVSTDATLKREILTKIPEHKKLRFEEALADYSETEYDKSINRIKQRINRSLAIIRVKMEQDLKEF